MLRGRSFVRECLATRGTNKLCDGAEAKSAPYFPLQTQCAGLEATYRRRMYGRSQDVVHEWGRTKVLPDKGTMFKSKVE